jgi:hypothetical protein
MQYNVTNTVLSGFARAFPGQQRRSPTGLRVAPLLRAPDRLRQELGVDAGPPPRSQLDRTVWYEISPPDPSRVTVWNPGPGAVVVHVGTLLRGGMCSRAVRSTTVLQGGSQTTVSVEALGARWWSEGALRVGGSLDPAVTALVLQGALARGGIAASARTAALTWSDWAIREQDSRWHAIEGWAVFCGDDLVAAWLTHQRFDWRGEDIEQHAGWKGDGVGALADRMRRDMEQGLLQGYAQVSSHDRCDLIVLDSTFRLVDRVAASRAAS